jgi:hypothetical protein
MNVSYADVEKHLLNIFTGEKLIYIDIGSNSFYLLLRQPNNNIKIRANFIYYNSYNKAIKEGMLPFEELEKLLNERSIFTDKDQKNIDRLESKLEGQRVLLGKTTKVKARSDRIKEVIKNLEDEINAIKYKKFSKLVLSAETKADEDKHSFICSNCTYTSDGNELYWKSNEDLMKETDLEFKNYVTTEFLKFYNGISTDVIRYIARNGLWRIRYVNSQKTSDPLFGISSSDYTNDQLNLVYWSNYYQNIYEMLPEDRPSDSVIEDDEALDSYMTSYYEERTREEASRRSNKDTGGKLSAFDKEEVIVTQSNELYEDIEYSKPREAQRIRDRADIKKRTIHGRGRK